MRALIVEDEPLLLEDLEQQLEEEQFYVDCSQTLKKARDFIAGDKYDLILLDLSLPDGDGLDLLRSVKKHDPDTAVIILTARGQVEDKVMGLELGSDDYLAKPFAMAELRARIHAVLRRKFKINENEITAAGLTVSLNHMHINFGGTELEMTETEYKILRYLVLNKNKTITRIALAEHIWGNKIDDRFSLDFINSHIKNIRKKLAEHNAPDCIKTVYGVGYKLEDHETKQ